MVILDSDHKADHVFKELKAYAAEIGITMFATAFDFSSADFLENLDMPAYKMALEVSISKQ